MPATDITVPDSASAVLAPAAREFVASLAAQDVSGAAAVRRSQAITDIVSGLTDYDDIRRGAFLFPLLEARCIDEPQATALFGAPAWQVASELLRLGSLGIAGASGAGSGLSAQQAEALRKMLLAIVTDPRLVLIKLAAQLHLLRESREAPLEERIRIGTETREIYAPLANRLGVWQLKWELEDWSFRYLDPDNYKRIAGLLASKRADREKYIEDTIQAIQRALTEVEIQCEVAGRPKHIFSIWRKMQRKGLSFEQLYDIRAVRVLVDSIADCYAALGIVHSLWPYIPGEFDDYIATPKDNLYRSLHTAVIGPGKLPVEIQIRTREMHEHAELGVAAHWRYKEGGKANPAYEQKIIWLRQILEPTDRDDETGDDFLERVRSEIFEDRVYALSPRGQVIELPRGATPLDFAYHVHTDLGHRCRGAKVNGKMVSLNQVLSNGDQVEIVTGKHSSPSRDWLVPSLGYLVSQRNRSKVRAWFRKQDEEQNRQQGRQALERELQRLAIHNVPLIDLVTEFKLSSAEQLYLAIGEGDITIAQITGAIQRRTQPQDLPSIVPRRAPPTTRQSSGITVDGVDDLLSHMARCCSPVPPESIAGFITLGRGVSIHRDDCANLKRLALDHPERVIPVDWGTGEDRSFPVEVNVRAFDRRGLVRDISGVLADSRINIHGMNTVTDAADGVADMNLKVTVHDLQELSRVLTRIQGLPNVLSVRRKN
jgi:GTP pyrophosphokinase